MPITKRPCSNCPFRKDGCGVQLREGRLDAIVNRLLQDDNNTFVCHKTLETERMTCAGAVAVMAKLDQLPVIARLGLIVGAITEGDIEASQSMVLDPTTLRLKVSTPGVKRRAQKSLRILSNSAQKVTKPKVQSRQIARDNG